MVAGLKIVENEGKRKNSTSLVVSAEQIMLWSWCVLSVETIDLSWGNEGVQHSDMGEVGETAAAGDAWEEGLGSEWWMSEGT